FEEKHTRAPSSRPPLYATRSPCDVGNAKRSVSGGSVGTRSAAQDAGRFTSKRSSTPESGSTATWPKRFEARRVEEESPPSLQGAFFQMDASPVGHATRVASGSATHTPGRAAPSR